MRPGALRLPPLTRDLQIDYTALSLVAPEKNRFRYMLEGRDTRLAGRRHAPAGVLLRSPSRRSIAFASSPSNNDGVWNETGASIDFEIAPAYYQTTWFLALVAGMLLTLVWGAHRLRLRIVEKHEREITALNERLMKAQEQERIRIAGELHDGVMQQMLAVTMMLGTAKRRIPDDSDGEADDRQDLSDKLVEVGARHPPAVARPAPADPAGSGIATGDARLLRAVQRQLRHPGIVRR